MSSASSARCCVLPQYRPDYFRRLRNALALDQKLRGRVEMAYVMGHQATDSIGRYGDKRYGRAEAVKVRPATALHAAC